MDRQEHLSHQQRHRLFFFIGEILTDIELTPDTPTADYCGKCTRCIDSCPTEALTPYELDATKCISYLTIEHKGEIVPELKKKMGTHLVGCDICQDVCPWNGRAPVSKEVRFDPYPGHFNPPIEDIAKMSPDDFSRQFKGSAVKRVKYEGLKRNVEIAKENSGRDIP